ncbi:MAG: bifunctional pyr operon transcriptional regulator/uracil phosphoribosyltransferase PyrR [Sandaracinaceae bacterium]|nr:bifunctional pyr operon transcriptional regulator/uracil phosphoribosyltransferase PyrR [Sandaracinaceae bacterium]
MTPSFAPDELARCVRRLAAEIADGLARGAGAPPFALVGIRRGGVPVARQLAREIAAREGVEVPVGTVEIALYRDDAATALPDPKIGPSEIGFDVRGRDVVLVDDVLETGRTVRAAIDCLLDYGRPRRIWLAVLFDRGGRELPIAPDFVGRVVEVPPATRLEVFADEVDGTLRMTEVSS